MKKIFFIIIILLVLLLVSIFLYPEYTKQIEWRIGLPGLTEDVTKIRNLINGFATDNQQLIEESSSSWTQNIVNGVNTLKDSVNSIKWKIENVRVTLSGAEETVRNAKETYDDTIQFFDETGAKIEDAKKALQDLEGLWDTIQWSINKEIMQ